MSCSDAKLLEGFPRELKKEVYHNEIFYRRYFFGGLDSTTIAASNYPAWDETKTDYAVGDRIYIDELKTVYMCGKAGNMDYPPSTSLWKPETGNDYRQIDLMPTTKSLSTDADVTNIYDVMYSTHLIGQFIDGVSQIVIEELDSSKNPTGKTLATIEMTKIVDYKCFYCCNPPPIRKRDFILDLKELECASRYIRVKLTRDTGSTYIRIGTLVPVRAINIGEPNFDLRVKINNGLEYHKIGISGDIDAVITGTTISLTGKSRITSDNKSTLYEMLMYYRGVTFTLTDVKDLKTIGGVVMGKLTVTNGLQVGLYTDRITDFSFKKEGVLA